MQTALQLPKLLRETFQKAQIEIRKLRGLRRFYAEKEGVPVGFEQACEAL